MLKRLVRLQFIRDSYTKNLIVVCLILTTVLLAIFTTMQYTVRLENHREAFLLRSQTQAKLLAKHLSSPFGTGRYNAAAQVATAELAYRNAISIYLFNNSGTLIYGASRSKQLHTMQPLKPNEYDVSAPVEFLGETIGRLVLVTSFDDWHSNFAAQFLTSVSSTIFECLVIVGLILTFIIQTLLKPLRSLSDTARRVREERTYAIRAQKKGIGELAELTDAFNSMLDHIEAHDMFLHSESRTLEMEVLERTIELEHAIEEAKNANQTKSEFVASVSHELRTPMNAILGMTNLLQTTKLSRKQKEYSEIIASSSQSLLHLINGVLDLSKIEAQKLVIEETTFRLLNVLDDIAVVFTKEIANQNKDLIISVAPDVPTTLRGDSFRLKQILLNLVGNAFKFTEKGTIELHVSCVSEKKQEASVPALSPLTKPKESTEPFQTIIFMVTDPGIGIPPELQEKLFDTFVQADGSTSRRYGGTGLGLSIVAGLVKLMNGDISITSKPGEGSTFKTALPFGVEPKQAIDTELLPIQGKKALVIEEYLPAHVMWQTYFSELGMTAVLVPSEQHAIASLLDDEEQQTIDLLVLGGDILKQSQGALAIFLQGYRKLPVLVSARLGEEKIPPECALLSVYAFLRKPVTLGQVRRQTLQAITTSDDTETRLHRFENTLTGLSVLVVEDNPINQKVIEETLSHFGVDATIAKDGETALYLLSTHTYDIVLMDIQLPDMDGYATTSRIRENSALEELPIIAMTAHTMQEDRDKAAAAGMNAYLTKPVELSALYTVLSLYQRKPACSRKKAQPPVQNLDETMDYLPGLRVSEGLSRIGGKMHIYRMILESFIETYQQAAEEIGTMVEEENYAEVAAKAHTLASASGSISAMEVYGISIAIEKAARTGMVERDMVSALVHAVEEACQSARLVIEATEQQAS
ncbi:MAG: ATP-binding protein [Desulfovibrionales bacterium]|nr:ATP-binding protein [Desulfovibrionales bacterium]